MNLSIETYKELIKRKEDLECNLLSIGIHAKLISEYMISIGIPEWENLSQWFHIAKSIKELNYDGITYDAAFFWCSPAYEYEAEKQALYQRLVKEITLFSYLYGGLEGVVSSLKLSKCPQQSGKINATTYYLAQEFNPWSLPISYYDKVVRLCEIFFQHSFDKNYKLFSELGPCVSIQGLGLKLLYKIRNKIMHGDFFFPEPLDHSDILPFHPEIINLCSRLILMTVQMLFIACRNGDYVEELQIYNSSVLPFDEDSEWLPNEKHYLLALHKKLPDFYSEQLELLF